MGFSRQSASRRISFRLFRNLLNHWKKTDSEGNKVGKAERQRTACHTDLKQRIRLSFFWGNFLEDFSNFKTKCLPNSANSELRAWISCGAKRAMNPAMGMGNLAFCLGLEHRK